MSTSGRELSATYVSPHADATRALAHKLTVGIEPAAVAVLGDSTANGPDEWFYEAMQWYGQQFPGYTLTQRLWSDAAQAYAFGTTIQTGTAGDRYADFAGSPTAGYFQTPDSVATSILGDLDVRAKITPDALGSDMAIAAKFGGAGERGWRWEVKSTGALQFEWSADGTALSGFKTSTALAFTAPGQTKWVRVTHDVDNGAAGNTITYYTSTDGVTWTVLGAPIVTAGITSHFNHTQPLEFGARTSGAALFNGRIYYLSVHDGIDGNPAAVVDLDALPPLGSTFTDYTGNVWTLSGTLAERGGAPGLALFNASTSGMGIAYSNDAARFPKQTPYPCDVAFISYSHNEGAGSLTYRAAYKQLADALIGKWPDVRIIAVTQNPKKAPETADKIAAHAIRCDQIASLAMAQRYGLVDAYRAFVDTGDPDALIAADGIHPTQPDGFDLWRDVAKAVLAAGLPDVHTRA